MLRECGRNKYSWKFVGHSWSFMFNKKLRDDGLLNTNCRKLPVNYQNKFMLRECGRNKYSWKFMGHSWSFMFNKKTSR